MQADFYMTTEKIWHRRPEARIALAFWYTERLLWDTPTGLILSRCFSIWRRYWHSNHRFLQPQESFSVYDRYWHQYNRDQALHEDISSAKTYSFVFLAHCHLLFIGGRSQYISHPAFSSYHPACHLVNVFAISLRQKNEISGQVMESHAPLRATWCIIAASNFTRSLSEAL